MACCVDYVSNRSGRSCSSVVSLVRIAARAGAAAVVSRSRSRGRRAARSPAPRPAAPPPCRAFASRASHARKYLRPSVLRDRYAEVSPSTDLEVILSDLSSLKDEIVFLSVTLINPYIIPCEVCVLITFTFWEN